METIPHLITHCILNVTEFLQRTVFLVAVLGSGWFRWALFQIAYVPRDRFDGREVKLYKVYLVCLVGVVTKLLQPRGVNSMKYTILATCALLSSATVASAQDLSDTFSSFLAFGDSLTDDGKFNGTPFQSGLPGLDGRFSNGRTYAEIIADDFAFSQNFAIGGATARNDNENPLPPQFGTFAGQVGTLNTLLTFDPTALANVGDRPLFSVLFGANDILQNVGLPDGPISPGNILPGIGALAADAVEDSIRAIAALDDDFNDFLVFNLPDVSQTPLFTNPLFGAGALAPLAALETNGFNAQLTSNIGELRNDGLNIIEFDLGALFEEQLAAAGASGIDTQTPCSFDLSNPGPENTCVFSAGSPDNTDLSLANDFFFIDGIHPNALAQANTAAAAKTTVAAAVAGPSVVPLPAGFPLLLAGLGAFGLLRSRRAA